MTVHIGPESVFTFVRNGRSGWAGICSCDRSGTDNTFRKTDDYTVVDLSSSYALNSSTRVYAKIDNVLDDQEIVSRSPHGARPNLPRTAYVGISVDF